MPCPLLSENNCSSYRQREADPTPSGRKGKTAWWYELLYVLPEVRHNPVFYLYFSTADSHRQQVECENDPTISHSRGHCGDVCVGLQRERLIHYSARKCFPILAVLSCWGLVSVRTPSLLNTPPGYCQHIAVFGYAHK